MSSDEPTVGSFSFAGAWTAPIPNGLILDARLTANDKLLWMVIRCGITNPSAPISPTYDFLVETSHMARSSVARSLLALRIAGWLNGNAEHRTDGYILGAKYVLYDRDRTMELSAVVTHREFVFSHLCNKGRIGRLALVVAEQIGLDIDELTNANAATAGSRKLEPLDLSDSSNLELPVMSSKNSSSNLLLTPNLGSSNLELPGSSNLEPVNLPSSSKLEPQKITPELGSSNLLPPENRGFAGAPHVSAYGSSSVVVFNSLLKEVKKQTTTTVQARALEVPALIQHLRGAIELEINVIPSDQLAQDLVDELCSRFDTARSPMALFRTLVKAALSGTFVLSARGRSIQALRKPNTLAVSSNVAATSLAVNIVEETWMEYVRRNEKVYPGTIAKQLEVAKAGKSALEPKHLKELEAVAIEFGVTV